VSRAPAGGTPPFRWDRIDVDGHTIASRHWDDGPSEDVPVVLVHGLVVSSAYHVPLAERLAPRFAVHAPDLPGFGRSDKPWPPLDTRQLGKALAGWLDARSLHGAAIVANSYGCQIAAEALLPDTRLASRLVLLGPTMDPRARRADRQLARFWREQRVQSPALKRLLFREYVTAGPRRAVATFQHAMHDAIEDKLPFLDLPTLVVRGSRDPHVPPAWAREVARHLPRAEVLELPGATHAVNHDMPLQTARVIARFLASDRDPAARAGADERAA
jgi:2-hydroxy-6-oxonona-2,4-dienedioate hydrolase